MTLPGYCEMSELLFWLLAFSACSAGMLLSNKLAVTHVPFPTALVLLQLVSAVGAIMLIPQIRRSLHFGSWRAVRTWGLSVSILFAGMLVSSIWSLRYASATVSVLVRNCAPILALAVETVFMPQDRIMITLPIVGSLLVCLFGAKLYTLHSPAIGTLGIVFLVTNLCVSVADRSCARYYLATEPLDISKSGMLLLNNAVAIFPVLLLMCATEDLPLMSKELGTTLAGLHWCCWLNLAFSCVAGMGIGYTGFQLQSRITASSFLVVTIANKAVVILIDTLLLSKVLSKPALAGCFMSILGSTIYGISSHTAQIKKETQPLLPQKDPDAAFAPETGAVRRSGAREVERAPEEA